MNLYGLSLKSVNLVSKPGWCCLDPWFLGLFDMQKYYFPSPPFFLLKITQTFRMQNNVTTLLLYVYLEHIF